MSVKIQGFMLEDGADVFALSKKARAVFLPILRKVVYDDFLKKMVNAYDMMTYSPATMTSFRNENGMDMNNVNFYRLWSAAQKQMREDMSEMPSEYQVSINYAQDPLTGKILCIWSGSAENYDIFKNFVEVKEYSFWDHYDKPDNISDEDWIEHREAWGRTLLPSGHIPTSCLMSAVGSPHELSPKVSFLEMKKRGATMPDMDWRIRNLAGFFILQEWVSSEEDPISNFSGMIAALADPDKIAVWRKFVAEDISSEALSFETLQDFLDSKKMIVG